MSIVHDALKGLYTHVVGRRVLYYARVGSTMDVAASEGESGAEEGTVVVADVQTRGRGRFRREWASLKGNLHVSVLLRPAQDVAPLVMVIAGLAVVRAIRTVGGLRAQIKWPNDVLLRGRKVAGMLAEGVAKPGGEGYVVLGIGINVNADPTAIPGLASIATSLSRELGKDMDGSALLRQLLQELDYLYGGLKKGEVPLEEWRGYLETLGQRVQFQWQDETYRGLAEDVDSAGNLIVLCEDGSRITVNAGEVSYVR